MNVSFNSEKNKRMIWNLLITRFPKTDRDVFGSKFKELVSDISKKDGSLLFFREFPGCEKAQFFFFFKEVLNFL